MRRTQIDFFFTRRQLAEVLVEVCRKHDAMLVALLRDPDERGLVDVAPDDIAAYLEQHHVPSIYVTLGPGQQPGDEGFEFLQRHPSIVVSFSAEDEAKREVYPSMANADPEGPSGPLLGTFKEAVQARSNKGVMARGAKKALPYWWERSLRDWKFPNYRLVLPEGEAKKTKAKKRARG